MKILTVVVAFLIGAVLSFICYLVSKAFYKKGESKYSIASVIRIIINVFYLFGLFVLGEKTGFDQIFLLIGGALGVTVPNIFFTMRLVKTPLENDKKGDDING